MLFLHKGSIQSDRGTILMLSPLPYEQRGAFITESVLRLIEGADPSSRGRPYHGISNPLVWQATNAGLVDRKASLRGVDT